MCAKGALHFSQTGRISKAIALLSSSSRDHVFGGGGVHRFAERAFEMSTQPRIDLGHGHGETEVNQ